jgi:serine/threonine-protein kinase HipA
MIQMRRACPYWVWIFFLSVARSLTMNGKRDGFALADFRACAKTALMKRGRAEAIVEKVGAAVAKWPDFAEHAAVAGEWRKPIQRHHRPDLRGD